MFHPIHDDFRTTLPSSPCAACATNSDVTSVGPDPASYRAAAAFLLIGFLLALVVMGLCLALLAGSKMAGAFATMMGLSVATFVATLIGTVIGGAKVRMGATGGA